MEILKEISETLQKGQAEKVQELSKECIAQGIDVKIILQALLDGMGVIGGKFKRNEVFVPEVLIAARAMNFGIDVIKPLFAEAGVEPIGKVVLGTVKGDLHDIGKNLVKMMMIGAGLEVIDIGIDAPADKFLKAYDEHKPDIIAMSALLTTTMPYMKNIIDAFEERGLRDKVKIMIGGAPITQDYADKIGADRYTIDASEAAQVAKSLVI